MLIYRHDVLKAKGYAVPETWQQLLEVADALNGTDFNADGLADSSLCVDVDESELAAWAEWRSRAEVRLLPELLGCASNQWPVGDRGVATA